jgi:hypothetical protein
MQASQSINLLTGKAHPTFKRSYVLSGWFKLSSKKNEKIH